MEDTKGFIKKIPTKKQLWPVRSLIFILIKYENIEDRLIMIINYMKFISMWLKNNFTLKFENSGESSNIWLITTYRLKKIGSCSKKRAPLMINT